MNPVKHLNNALDMLAHRGLECSGVWDQVIAARDDLLAARKTAERRKTVRAKRPVQQPQPESVTGSVPHRSCAGCPEYGLDRDCSGKCP